MFTRRHFSCGDEIVTLISLMPSLVQFKSQFCTTFGQLSILAYQRGQSLHDLSTDLSEITPQQLSTILPMFVALKEFRISMESLTTDSLSSIPSIRASSSIFSLELDLENGFGEHDSAFWPLALATFPGLERISINFGPNELLQPDWGVCLQSFLSAHSSIRKVQWISDSPDVILTVLSLQSTASHLIILSEKLTPDMLPHIRSHVEELTLWEFCLQESWSFFAAVVTAETLSLKRIQIMHFTYQTFAQGTTLRNEDAALLGNLYFYAQKLASRNVELTDKSGLALFPGVTK
jgi:hypothetical protein